jgi:hypothetical protein
VFGRVVLLFALLLASASAYAQSKWITYDAKAGGFRIDLPSQPSVNTATSKTGRGTARSSWWFAKGDNGLECRLEAKDYEPGKISKDARGYLDESRAYHDNRRPVRNESRFSMDGNPAQRFIVDTVDGRVARLQEVVVGDLFISVVCFVPKAQQSSPDLDRIFRSFVLAKP